MLAVDSEQSAIHSTILSCTPSRDAKGWGKKGLLFLGNSDSIKPFLRQFNHW